MNDALQGPRAIHRIVPRFREPFARRFIQRERDFAIFQKPPEAAQLDIHNRSHIPACQAPEQHNLIQPVQKFRAEAFAHGTHHRRARCFDIGALRQFRDGMGTQIAGQHNDGVAEINRPPLAIRQPSIIQHLQQHIEDIIMCLFNLIEQDHLIWPPPHGFRQRTAFFIANIARRCADQPRYRVLFHIFRHINARHGAIIIEQKSRQRFHQFRLANTSWAQEQEAADRAIRVLQARACAAHGLGNRFKRFFLADHALAQLVFHPQQLGAFAFQHFLNGNTGPAAHYRRNAFFRYGFIDQLGIAIAGISQFLFNAWDNAIEQFGSLGQIAAALRQFNLGPRLVQFFLELLAFNHLALFRFPACGHGGGAFLKLRQFLLKLQ